MKHRNENQERVSFEPPKQPIGIGTILLWILNVFGLLVVIAFLYWVVPGVLRTYNDFGAPLPASIRFAARLSRLSVTYWWSILPVIICFMGMMAHAVFRRQKDEQKRFRISLALFMLIAACALLLASTTFWPFQGIKFLGFQ